MKYRNVFSWWIEEKIYGGLVANVDNYLKISCMEILFVNYFVILLFCYFVTLLANARTHVINNK